MRCWRVAFVVLAALGLAAPALAAGGAWGSVGMIQVIRNAASGDDVKVERTGEGRHPIAAHDPLYNGDHLIIRGGAMACVNVSGTRTCWTSRTKNTTVASPGVSVSSILDAAFFRAIGLGPPAAGMGIATGTLVRAPRPLEPIGLLSAATQYVTPTTRTVVAGWRGPAGALILTSADGTVVRLPAPAEGFAVAPVPRTGADFRIAFADSDIAWTVRMAPAAPSPPWYKGHQPAIGLERMARAAWIITDGPPEWRMFALGELADLAGRGDEGAAALYRGALEGRLQRRAPSDAP